MVLQDFRACGGAYTLRREHVFDGNRHAKERRIVATGNAYIGCARHRQRPVIQHGQIHIQARVQQIDAVEKSLR